MLDFLQQKPLKPIPSIEAVSATLSVGDLNDLCDATEAAIEAGGGFGWLDLPNRAILERVLAGGSCYACAHAFRCAT